MHTSIPTNQERHACVPTSNCKDMHLFAMYISLLFCNVVYKECSGEGYHTVVLFLYLLGEGSTQL